LAAAGAEEAQPVIAAQERIIIAIRAREIYFFMVSFLSSFVFFVRLPP
jgi:hypothetical protein